ncbi:MAG TPA: hypothetical protein VGC58_02265 [Candidatus Paceibacterota bacterium]
MEKNNIKFTDKKVVVAGSHVRVFLYDGLKHAYNYNLPKRCRLEPFIPEDESESEKAFRVESEKLEKIERRKKSMLNAKSRLTDTINSNLWRYLKEDGRPYIPIFLTFTFKEDVTNVSDANYILNKFLKRLNYEIIGQKGGFLKYSGVIEHQDKNRNGVIHYHIVFFNLKFIWADKLAEIWGEGYIKIKKIGKVKDIAKYLTKYMSKNFEDSRLDGKKRILSSRGLFKPIVYLDETWADRVYRVIPKKCLTNQKEYWSKYDGQVKKQEFIIPRNMDLEQTIAENFLHDYHQ